MSADRLREAARVLRERAETITARPGRAIDNFVEYYELRSTSSDALGIDAAYIATMHPGVGLALARALDTAADAIGDSDFCTDCFHPTCLTVGELIPVADLILGGAS